MKVLAIVAACVAIFQTVSAQNVLLGQLPSCAVSPHTIHGSLYHDLDVNQDGQAQCFEATISLSSCSPNDISCLCTDVAFQNAAAACNAANCTVVAMLSATNETYAACGIPIRDKSQTMIAVTASIGALAFLMVVMRLVDRAFSSQARLGWDDLLIGLSGVSSERVLRFCR
jgi:hypothetical protein